MKGYFDIYILIDMKKTDQLQHCVQHAVLTWRYVKKVPFVNGTHRYLFCGT